MPAKKKTSTKIPAAKEPQSMEELLARSGLRIIHFRSGEKIKAKVININKKSVTFDIGGKSEGSLSGADFDEVKSYVKKLRVGDNIDAIVVDPETPDGTVRISLRHFAADAIWQDLEAAQKTNNEIDVVGKSLSDKGIVVELDSSLVGFIPASQLGKEAIKKVNDLIGSRFKVKVVELDKKRNRVVLSERAVSEKEEIKLHDEALQNVTEGSVLQGIVTQVTSFGAFVEINLPFKNKKVPVEGLVHISELSWEKVEDPQSSLKEGDKVEVMVLGVENNKLALSMKQAKKDPWDEISDKYTPEQKVKGIITRKSSFGCFVELEPGVEGLVHLTKIPPGTNLKKGQEVNCYIEELNPDERRISLGLILSAKPVGYK